MRGESSAAQRGPARREVDRQRTELKRLSGGESVARLLDRIVVEGGDFRFTHARGCEPARNIGVVEPLDIDQDLAGTGAGGGTGRRKGVADQHDAVLSEPLQSYGGLESLNERS